MGTERHQTDTTAWRTFTSDLRLAFGAWRKAPALPLISALLPLILTGTTLLAAKGLTILLGTIAVAVIVFNVGWVGTERLWYLRLFRGDRLTATEAVKFTFKYIPAFAILGFIMYMGMFVPGMFILNLMDGSFVLFVGLQVASAIIFDVLLTFMTPAVAYSDFMVHKAIGRGLRMLRDHWQHAKYYALVPPLAVVVTTQYIAREIGVIGAVSLAVVGGLLNLWFKGATAAYYLRHNTVGRNGRFDREVFEREASAYLDK